MILDICKNLVYHRLEVSVSPEERTEINGWLGAILRNNLLFAAEQVVTKDGVSLLSVINRLNISEEHPLYKSLVGGAPKGFVLSLLSHSEEYSSHSILNRGEILTFSLTLIGSCISYYTSFVEAIRNMCIRGIGEPMVPFKMIEICERDISGRSSRVAVAHSDKIASLRYPVRLSDFEEEKFGQRETMIRLCYQSPLLLVMPANKTNKDSGYQDKLNGFPSFYQFIRSAVYRCIKLAALYACPDDIEKYREAEAGLGRYIDSSASAMLLKADIRWVSLAGSKRDDGRERMILKGYVGETVFGGDFAGYMPLLLFMQGIGVGNDTVYGLGDYRVEVLRIKES